MNSLISSVLYTYPKPEITFQEIKSSCKQTYDYIVNQGYKTYISASPQNYDINQAVLNLGFTVKGKPMDKKLGNQAIVDLEEKE